MKMQFPIATILFIIFEQINKLFGQSMPISPCPKMFQYRFDGTEWYGILSVRNPDFGQALHLKVTLTMRGKPTTNYLGEIELLTRGQYLSDAPVMYKVKFPKHQFPPKLIQISTNNHVVCIGAADHGIFVTQIQLEHTRKFTFNIPTPLTPDLMDPDDTAVKDTSSFPSDLTFGSKHLPLANLEKSPLRMSKDICGKIDNRIRFQMLSAREMNSTPEAGAEENVDRTTGDLHSRMNHNHDNSRGAPVIVAGMDDENPKAESSLTRGSWPWLAAIYVNNITSLSYQCGGTLVSSRVVVSSAHCFHLFQKRYTANEVLVFLGRHNLKNWNEEGSLAAPVDDLFIYPEYNSHLNTYDADIAILLLKNEVHFNIFIRPACLWSGSTKFQYIEGEHGIVVGWGTPDASLSTAVPRIVEAPIVSKEVCFKADHRFRSLSSNRTFCAGNAAPHTMLSSGVCTGDSGGGLLIFKNNRWFLRGIVSAMLPVAAKGNASSSALKHVPNCSTNQFVIYTDVAQFLDWIFAFIL